MSRIDLKALDDIKWRLSEAVVDPAEWVNLMQQICDASFATGAALLQSDIRTPEVPLTLGVRDAFSSYFRENLHVNDVRARKGAPRLQAGQLVVRDQDLFANEAEMFRDPLYAHNRPFNIRWFAAVTIWSGSSLWGLSLQRSPAEGAFQDDEVKILATLSQKMTEVATLSKAVGRQALSGSMDAFQLIAQPAIAISGARRVIQANAQAEAMFDDEFLIKNGRLFLSDAKAIGALDRLLYEADRSPSEMFGAGGRNFIVANRRDRRPLVLHVLPVAGAARVPFLGAKFIVLVKNLATQDIVPEDAVARVFSLTPAEARVAVMISSGLSPDEVAELLSVSSLTVRNQLKAVFLKTETHRQSQLAALISRLR